MRAKFGHSITVGSMLPIYQTNLTTIFVNFRAYNARCIFSLTCIIYIVGRALEIKSLCG